MLIPQRVEDAARCASELADPPELGRDRARNHRMDFLKCQIRADCPLRLSAEKDFQKAFPEFLMASGDPSQIAWIQCRGEIKLGLPAKHQTLH